MKPYTTTPDSTIDQPVFAFILMHAGSDPYILVLLPHFLPHPQVSTTPLNHHQPPGLSLGHGVPTGRSKPLFQAFKCPGSRRLLRGLLAAARGARKLAGLATCDVC